MKRLRSRKTNIRVSTRYGEATCFIFPSSLIAFKRPAYMYGGEGGAALASTTVKQCVTECEIV